ncbi:hypothetical protein SLITK23_12950 [Streptomyces lividans]|nr:predicted protein [Streptomyces lividans TK24]BDE38050.1 hypothetical protein SLITK23_12950 [Streptomyces lividans]
MDLGGQTRDGELRLEPTAPDRRRPQGPVVKEVPAGASVVGPARGPRAGLVPVSGVTQRNMLVRAHS